MVPSSDSYWFFFSWRNCKKKKKGKPKNKWEEKITKENEEEENERKNEGNKEKKMIKKKNKKRGYKEKENKKYRKRKKKSREWQRTWWCHAVENGSLLEFLYHFYFLEISLSSPAGWCQRESSEEAEIRKAGMSHGMAWLAKFPVGTRVCFAV